MYNEEDFLQLSGIQHFEFCKRQWALAYIELQWQENVRTVEGKILHENAHDASIKEKRDRCQWTNLYRLDQRQFDYIRKRPSGP